MTAQAPEKERVTVYLDPELSLLLRRERADTRKPVTEIVEDIIRAHYADESQRKRRTAASA